MSYPESTFDDPPEFHQMINFNPQGSGVSTLLANVAKECSLDMGWKNMSPIASYCSTIG